MFPKYDIKQKNMTICVCRVLLHSIPLSLCVFFRVWCEFVLPWEVHGQVRNHILISMALMMDTFLENEIPSGSESNPDDKHRHWNYDELLTKYNYFLMMNLCFLCSTIWSVESKRGQLWINFKCSRGSIRYRTSPAPLLSVEDVNQWVKNATNGNIVNLMESIPHDVVLMLINAVHFKGSAPSGTVWWHADLVCDAGVAISHE